MAMLNNQRVYGIEPSTIQGFPGKTLDGYFGSS